MASGGRRYLSKMIGREGSRQGAIIVWIMSYGTDDVLLDFTQSQRYRGNGAFHIVPARLPVAH